MFTLIQNRTSFSANCKDIPLQLCIANSDVIAESGDRLCTKSLKIGERDAYLLIGGVVDKQNTLSVILDKEAAEVAVIACESAVFSPGNRGIFVTDRDECGVVIQEAVLTFKLILFFSSCEAM